MQDASVYAVMVLKTLEDVTYAKCDNLWGIFTLQFVWNVYALVLL